MEQCHLQTKSILNSLTIHINSPNNIVMLFFLFQLLAKTPAVELKPVETETAYTFDVPLKKHFIRADFKVIFSFLIIQNTSLFKSFFCTSVHTRIFMLFIISKIFRSIRPFHGDFLTLFGWFLLRPYLLTAIGAGSPRYLPRVSGP